MPSGSQLISKIEDYVFNIRKQTLANITQELLKFKSLRSQVIADEDCDQDDLSNYDFHLNQIKAYQASLLAQSSSQPSASALPTGKKQHIHFGNELIEYDGQGLLNKAGKHKDDLESFLANMQDEHSQNIFEHIYQLEIAIEQLTDHTKTSGAYKKKYHNEISQLVKTFTQLKDKLTVGLGGRLATNIPAFNMVKRLSHLLRQARNNPEHTAEQLTEIQNELHQHFSVLRLQPLQTMDVVNEFNIELQLMRLQRYQLELDNVFKIPLTVAQTAENIQQNTEKIKFCLNKITDIDMQLRQLVINTSHIFSQIAQAKLYAEEWLSRLNLKAIVQEGTVQASLWQKLINIDAMPEQTGTQQLEKQQVIQKLLLQITRDKANIAPEHYPGIEPFEQHFAVTHAKLRLNRYINLIDNSVNEQSITVAHQTNQLPLLKANIETCITKIKEINHFLAKYPGELQTALTQKLSSTLKKLENNQAKVEAIMQGKLSQELAKGDDVKHQVSASPSLRKP